MQTQGLVQGLDFNGSEEEWEDLQHYPWCAKGKMRRFSTTNLVTKELNLDTRQDWLPVDMLN